MTTITAQALQMLQWKSWEGTPEMERLVVSVYSCYKTWRKPSKTYPCEALCAMILALFLTC